MRPITSSAVRRHFHCCPSTGILSYCAPFRRQWQLPYNVNIFTLTAAELVIERRSLLNQAIANLIRERDRVFDELQKRASVRAFPSKANFILMKTARPAHRLFDALYSQGVLVRDVSSYPLLDRCLRVSIGTPEENDRFLVALDQALENKNG